MTTEGKVRRTTTRSRKWRAWAGTPEDLDRVGRLFSELAEKRRKTFLEDWDQRRASTELKSEGFVADYRDARRNEVVVNSEPVLNLWQDGDVIRGPVDEVRPELDRRTFRMLNFSATLDGAVSQEVASLSLMRLSRFRDEANLGVSLDVKSTDREWAASTFSQLSDEIDKSRPSWHWVRYRRVRTAMTIALSVGLYMLISAIIKPAPTAVVFLVAILCGLSAAAAGLDSFWDRMFPAVEVDAGAGARTWARISVIVLTVLSLPIGLVVNALYDKI